MSRWYPLPAGLYRLVEQTPGTVLLESARLEPARSGGADAPPLTPPNQHQSRLFMEPIRVCLVRQSSELPNLFAEIETAVAAGFNAAGYFSYECGTFFEPAALSHAGGWGSTEAGLTPQPLAWFGIYERPFVFDHLTGVFDREPPGLTSLGSSCPKQGSPSGPLDCVLTLDEAEYAGRINAIHEWIRAGDVYQLNLTWPIKVQLGGSSAALYGRLRHRQPAPYGAFLHTERSQRVLCFSPELFFHLQNQGETRRIVTRPMKGTAPRGRTTSEDRALAHWLENDAKNRSENVMIVDLLRNDLGRVCAFNSICASNLLAVERYPTLWQMTSTVSGELRPEVTFEQIFRALFPCGSITGVPKIRAMKLLSEIEARPRGVYSGAIGFFSKAESVFNVAIRTLALEGEPPCQSGTFAVGSGIVIDSKPDDEFRECLLKAEFLTSYSSGSEESAMEGFSLIESLLWSGSYPRLELHLDRLEDSAHYFGFPFNRAEVKAALATYSGRFPEREPRKVRLLLGSESELTINHEVLPAPTARPLRIHIAAVRTDPQDRMYFHKTSHRPLYSQAFEAAMQTGYDDVLFLNLRNEVTEAAIHNIFVEKNGCLATPAIGCGVLPGVERRHILASHCGAEEKVLTLDDLRQADAVYLCNAVRGLRRAIVDWESE